MEAGDPSPSNVPTIHVRQPPRPDQLSLGQRLFLLGRRLKELLGRRLQLGAGRNRMVSTLEDEFSTGLKLGNLGLNLRKLFVFSLNDEIVFLQLSHSRLGLLFYSCQFLLERAPFGQPHPGFGIPADHLLALGQANLQLVQLSRVQQTKSHGRVQARPELRKSVSIGHVVDPHMQKILKPFNGGLGILVQGGDRGRVALESSFKGATEAELPPSSWRLAYSSTRLSEEEGS
ncbi:hypothetical protein Pyn_09853 [Prunus yedoensis var. nudiflora]|uniref:Uncharacterized protein n=1 Tax=Prunus yedoensis var. nudiflora TaxID=2094558 RepID=A0A314ULA4_PRUYE|nr:hypothetical protein Pyn_09853 [Prunus yedoensis var. nudiflora]